MNELSNNVISRFVKDYKLPINVIEEPIFSYCIETLDSQYKTKEKLNYLTNLINNIGEDNFFKESSKITNQVIEAISRKNVYKTLSEDLLKEYQITTNVPSSDIYSMNNVGKHFISFDLVKANFQAFKKYSKELVLNSNTYEELMSNFTNEKYFIESKQIRQVIFGNTLPKKQQIIQKNIINSTINDLVHNTSLELKDFCNASADEFIIKKDTKEEVDNLFLEIKNHLDKNGYDGYRLEEFKLNNIGNRKFFVKEFFNGDIDFKGIPSFYFLQAYKEYFKLPLDSKDLQFIYEGQLSSFLEPIFKQNDFELNLNLNQ